jgi:hypothetical protein
MPVKKAAASRRQTVVAEGGKAQFSANDHFVSKLISTSDLPDTPIVKAQLDWLVRPNGHKVFRATPPAGEVAVMRQTADQLHQALDLLRQVHGRFTKWADLDRVETASQFQLGQLAEAAHDSAWDFKDWHKPGRRDFTRLLPIVDPRLEKFAKEYSAKSKKDYRQMPRSDPQEEALVGLLALVFLSAGKKPTCGKDGLPSQFQEACFSVLERRGHSHETSWQAPTLLCENTQAALHRRVRTILKDPQIKTRIQRIAAIEKLQPTTDVTQVKTNMSIWIDWLVGFPIPLVG